MPYIAAHATNRDLDYDGLIDRIRVAFPAVKVTKEDYHADRIVTEERIAHELGMPRTNAPLECLRRVAQEHGIQREIEICLDNDLRLIGHLDRFGVLFNGDRTLSRREVQSLLNILIEAGLVVETSVLE